MRDPVRVLATPTRRRLLELLLEGEQSVSSLASHFGVTRPAISQHLAVLARAGLVGVRKEGRFRYYRVIPEGLAELRASLDVFWTRELEDLAASGPHRQGETPMPIEKSVLVPLDADETFALLTEPERLRRWHVVSARIDLRAGGDYRWTITPGHNAAGNVVEVEPGRRLVITWGWEGEAELPPGASTVTVTLEPTAGGTMVRLVHDNLPDEQVAGHTEGWEHYLERLVAAAGDGDAGVDEWAAAPDPIDRLTAAEASLAVCQRVLRGLDADAGSLATPCSEFTLEDLLGHLLGGLANLGGMAGATVAVGGDASAESRLAGTAQQAIEAWRRRGLEGDVATRDGTMPASLAAGILSLELLVHGWDFARATSRPITVDDSVSSYVLGVARELISPERRQGVGFGPEVATAPDAGPLERLVAFTGRNP